jgi:GT2 family glycosyltransferase/glycosyltransferase involved in cell wall biosynthesis
MTPEERTWIVEVQERVKASSAAAAVATDTADALETEVVKLRQRLDALSCITGQIGIQAGVGPEHLIAQAPQLANGDFISDAQMTFNYDRVLSSVASWNTSQENILNFERYDTWFREHGRPVAIIIPSFEDHHVLDRCLLSLRRAMDLQPSIRVIVSDDASPSKAHKDFLKRIEREGIIVIRNARNMGFAGNVNHALEFVGDEDIVLLNSDVEAEGFWLEALQYASRVSGAGIVGARLLYPNRTIQHAGVHRNLASPRWFDHTHRGRGEFYGPACVPGYHLAVTGACLYISNQAYRKLGGLDPMYPMAFEDVDYCLRAWVAGEQVLYYPYACLVHHESVTRGRVQGAREIASQDHFWKKWAKFFDGRLIGAAFEETMAAPDIVYVLQETGIAGGHRNVFDHVNLLIDAGWSVEVWCLDVQPAWFNLRTCVRTFTDFGALAAALKPLPCIKVATWWATAETVWLASREHGHAAYLVSDIEASYYVDDPFMSAQVLASYKLDFRFFTICEWNRQQLAQLGIDATLVSCSVDRDIFHPLDIPRRKDVLLAPGRRNHLKNFQFTLRAWASLGDDRPLLWMYGGEPDIVDFLDRTRYFIKPTDAYLNRIINEATAFVLTSRHEGFALTILEAMSAGTPVITTDCHGNRDFCSDGVNCLMVADGDHAGLVGGIRRLMSDMHLRERLRTNGLETAGRFSRDAMQRQLVAFFRSFSGIEPKPGRGTRPNPENPPVRISAAPSIQAPTRLQAVRPSASVC